jgi:hypothetical protein
MNRALPDSYIARFRECERLAANASSPVMAAILRRLAKVWRELASSPLRRPRAEFIAQNRGGSGARLKEGGGQS